MPVSAALPEEVARRPLAADVHSGQRDRADPAAIGLQEEPLISRNAGETVHEEALHASPDLHEIGVRVAEFDLVTSVHAVNPHVLQLHGGLRRGDLDALGEITALVVDQQALDVHDARLAPQQERPSLVSGRPAVRAAHRDVTTDEHDVAPSDDRQAAEPAQRSRDHDPVVTVLSEPELTTAPAHMHRLRILQPRRSQPERPPGAVLRGGGGEHDDEYDPAREDDRKHDPARDQHANEVRVRTMQPHGATDQVGDRTPSAKRDAELAFWRDRQAEEQTLRHTHYRRFYRTHFGLDESSYAGKRVLDIGCGPRGSLEWAEMALERVGLDPLAEEYMELGARDHAMSYVASGSEAIPFPDGHFDVVCSFNSLDHVDDLDRTIAEICRVVAVGGLFLLLVDVNHEPTPCEPITFSWDIVERFTPVLRPLRVERYEKSAPGIYASVDAAIPYDDADETERYGVLSAMFVKA
jgi:SAM-dependent methyltransferase